MTIGRYAICVRSTNIAAGDVSHRLNSPLIPNVSREKVVTAHKDREKNRRGDHDQDL